MSPRLVIEEGAFFQGDCEMTPAAGSTAGRSALVAIAGSRGREADRS